MSEFDDLVNALRNERWRWNELRRYAQDTGDAALIEAMDAASARYAERSQGIWPKMAPDLVETVQETLNEIFATHTPLWYSAVAKAAGKAPIGCMACYPADGDWPCVAKMVADDLEHALKVHLDGT